MNDLLAKGLKLLATLTSVKGRQKLFILIYHQVLDEPDPMRPVEIDIQAFDWQMQLLAKHFNVLPLADALNKMQGNCLPPRSVCITFDDGYADNLKNALPILKQYNLEASFFIATGYLNGGRMWNDTVIESLRSFSGTQLNLNEFNLGSYNTENFESKSLAASQIITKIKHINPIQREEIIAGISSYAEFLPDDLMLTDDQLLQLKLNGMEIGGHTVTHPIMAKCSLDQLVQELTDNKKTLETLTQSPVRFFAYPNGKLGHDYLVEHTQLVKNSGYEAAVTTEWGVAKRSSDVYQLPRFTPWDKEPLKFMLRMISHYARG